MKVLLIPIIISTFLTSFSYSWEPETNLLQQTLWPEEASTVEVIYQRGSQVYLKMKRDVIKGEVPPDAHIGFRNQLVGSEVGLKIPSFMTVLTMNEPEEGDIILGAVVAKGIEICYEATNERKKKSLKFS